jgi:hypothetical protein
MQWKCDQGFIEIQFLIIEVQVEERLQLEVIWLKFEGSGGVGGNCLQSIACYCWCSTVLQRCNDCLEVWVGFQTFLSTLAPFIPTGTTHSVFSSCCKHSTLPINSPKSPPSQENSPSFLLKTFFILFFNPSRRTFSFALATDQQSPLACKRRLN